MTVGVAEENEGCAPSDSAIMRALKAGPGRVSGGHSHVIFQVLNIFDRSLLLRVASHYPSKLSWLRHFIKLLVLPQFHYIIQNLFDFRSTISIALTRTLVDALHNSPDLLRVDN